RVANKPGTLGGHAFFAPCTMMKCFKVFVESRVLKAEAEEGGSLICCLNLFDNAWRALSFLLHLHSSSHCCTRDWAAESTRMRKFRQSPLLMSTATKLPIVTSRRNTNPSSLRERPAVSIWNNC